MQKNVLKSSIKVFVDSNGAAKIRVYSPVVWMKNLFFKVLL